MNRLPRLLCVPLIYLAVSAAPSLHAQANGSLHGQVTDPSGAIVPGASVQLSGAGGKVYSATSGGDGSYSFGTLPAGTYSLDVIVAGFTPFSESGVNIVNGTSRALNIPLAIANQEQQVEVTADSSQLDTSPESNANSVVISGKDLDALSDDPDEMQNQLTALAGPAAGNGGSQIYIDGYTGGDLPPKASIREIRINQNPFSAEFDKLGYGRIEILTKPGTEKLHGQIQASGNDSAFNTSHFVTSTPSYYQYFLNGSIGGPINSKSSYFASVFAKDVQNILLVNAAGSPADPNTAFVQSLLNPQSRIHAGPRFDFQLTPSNTLTVRYQYNREIDTGDGVGQLNLAQQAYNTTSYENTLQISDSQVINAHLVNETRFQYQRDRDSQTPQFTTPTITVQGIFTGGGSNDGTSRTAGDHYELQNYSTGSFKSHSLRFGARLRAFRESDYSNAGTNGSYTFVDTAAYLAGTPSQGTLTKITNFAARATLFDAGLFYQDDWKVNKKLTVDYGLRFEGQNRINDHANWGPRFGLAYALDGGGKKPPKTVFRAGYGWFYNRFTNASVIQAIHLNGVNQQQLVFQNPIYDPNAPPTGSATSNSRAATYRIAPNLKTALDMQGAASIDRSITKSITANVTYLYSRGIHQYLSNNINAPSYDYETGTLGPAPDPDAGNIYEYQSGGIYKQSQLITSVNARAKQFTLNGFYVLGYFKSDTTGVNYFPSRQNPAPGQQNNITFDYGRSSNDVRNRVGIVGSTTLPWNIQASLFMIANGGAPFNITTGRDQNRDNQFNERPGLVSADLCTPGSTRYYNTTYGCLDVQPTASETILPYGSGRGPVNFSADVRLSKTFGIGPKLTGKQGGAGGPGGGPDGGGRGGGHGGLGPGGLNGGGGGGFFGGPRSKAVPHKYNLTFTAAGHDVFNFVNLAQPNNVVTSPTFNQSLSVASDFFNRNQTSLRTIDLQATFSF